MAVWRWLVDLGCEVAGPRFGPEISGEHVSDELNEQERRFLDVVARSQSSDYVPSNEELLQETGVTSVSALNVLKRNLTRRRFLRRNSDTPLGIAIVRRDDLASPLPLSSPTETQPKSGTASGLHSSVSWRDPERRRQQQRLALEFIHKFQQEHSSSPSYDEIGEAVNLLSKESVSRLMEGLQEARFIRRDKNAPRKIELTPRAHSLLGLLSNDLPQAASGYVPLLGRIVAGKPTETMQNDEGGLLLPPEIIGSNKVDDLFLLRVDGHSMTEAGVLHGDVVLVHRVTTVSNGDLVAALLRESVGGESPGTTVKRYVREDDQVWLKPAHPAFEPINGDQAEVQGKVIALLRWPLGAP
jgi:repressor LexA